MGKFVINGGKKLYGGVKIQGSKNAVLPMIAGALLTEDEVLIENCPKIDDVITMTKILNDLGVKTSFIDCGLLINSSCINSYTVNKKMSKKLRSSIFLMGALVSRLKKALITIPGGCDIGIRPIDIHISSLKELGVDFTFIGEEIFCCAENLKGGKIRLNYPSVGATENALMASVLACGETIIDNVAKEPEVCDFINFLNNMGAEIYGAGTKTLVVKGVKKLHGIKYKPIFDRIEAGTFLLAGIITGGNIEIYGVDYKNISCLTDKFYDNTCKIRLTNDIMYIQSGEKRNSFSLDTGPFPAFPTDLQAQAMAYLSVADGVSYVNETVFENRFKHVKELNKMGADIKIEGNVAIVNGVKKLKGARVKSTDLRAGASLVLAGLVADGTTEVCGIEHILRGYQDLDLKLRALGADVTKV